MAEQATLARRLGLGTDRGAATAAATATRRRFDALYRAHRAGVLAYARSVVGDGAGAEDVAAETFERALRKRALYDARRGSERAWLFGIARNAALDELRRRRRRGPLVDVDVDAVADDVPSASDDGADAERERRARVRAALATLGPRDRELLALKFAGGLSGPELARVLEISETNASTRVHRALTALRRACDV